MPSIASAEIVVIGGGAVGLGAAYALAKAGKRDIVLIEKEADVAACTTSQGAGLAGQLRSSLERTQLAMVSVATFRELEKDPVARPGWRPVGSLRIAETAARAKEFEHLLEIAAQAGLGVVRVGVEEVAK